MENVNLRGAAFIDYLLGFDTFGQFEYIMMKKASREQLETVSVKQMHCNYLSKLFVHFRHVHSCNFKAFRPMLYVDKVTGRALVAITSS
jgi:hypothetical protein